MVEDLPHCAAGELIPAEALANVPGYRPDDPTIETTRLPGGSVNRSYRIATPAGRFVLRLSEATDAWLVSDRSVERELQGIAADAGIAPRIVHADGRDRWLITELATGSLWQDADFSSPPHLARLGGTLRHLHELAVPAAGRFDVLAALNGYFQRIATGPTPASKGTRAAVGGTGNGETLSTQAVAQYVQAAPAAWQVSGAADRPVAILHHDLHASNIIESPRGPQLIDWECAAVSDPLLDVACILSYYTAARPHATGLLRAAGLEKITPRQLAAALWLFDLHTYLWYRERRARLSPTNAELRAEQRLAGRLPAGLERWQTTIS
jgi:aminoglycoside phosphotransferase (APT) family kinase protein